MTGAFARDGFALLGRVLSASELAVAQRGVESTIDAAVAASGMAGRGRWLKVVNQVRDPEQWDPALGLLRHHPTLRAAAARALDAPDVTCAFAHLVFKPPGSRVHLPWHADRPTWRTLPADAPAVTTWVAMDDVPTEAGALRYVPGSHLDPDGDPDPVVVPAAAGEGLVHHEHVLHASGPNRTERWRRAWIGVWVRAIAS